MVLLTVFLITSFSSVVAQAIDNDQEHEEESGEEIRAREAFLYERRAGGPGKLVPPDGYVNAIGEVQVLKSKLKSEKQLFASSGWISRNVAGMFYARTGNNYIAGRTNSIAFHPTDPNTFYAAAAGGGVWKTTDGGVNWIGLTDQLSTVTAGAVAVDPVNPNIVYYASGELNFSLDSYYGDGIFQSTNAGASWNKIASKSIGSYFSQISINPSNPNIIFASGSSGVYRTTNGGALWTSTVSGSNANCIIIDPVNPQILYTSVGGSGTNSVRKSTNGGSNWTTLSGGLPTSDFGRTLLAMSPSNTSMIYASIARTSDGGLRGLYRSTDAGVTWTLQNSTTNYLGTQGWYDNTITVHPTNPNFVLVGGIDIYSSTNGGVTLTQKTSWSTTNPSNMSHADIHFMGYFGTVLYCGSDGGVYKSTNDGTSWTDLNATMSTLQYQSADYDPTDPQKLYGGCQDNNLQTSTNNGLTWIQRETGDGGYSIVDPVIPTIVYGQYVNGSLKRSMNSGVNFTEISPSGSTGGLFYNPYEMAPGDHNTIVFGQSDVWKTTSATTATTTSDWVQIAASSTVLGSVSSIGISSTNTNKIYIGTSNGRILTTSDNGANWGVSPGFSYVSDFAVDPANDNIAYASFAGFNSLMHVYKTTNGGASWVNITTTHPNIPVNSIILRASAPRTIFTGTDLGVFKSTDEGATWTAFNEDLPPAQVFDLKYKEGPAILLAATHGRGVFTRALGSSEFVVTPSTLAFDSVVIGSSLTDSVTVTNPDFGTLVISSKVSDNSAFTVGAFADTVPAFGSRKIAVTFAPSALGTTGGSIVFQHNGTTSPDTVAVTGIGYSAPPAGGTFTVLPDSGVHAITQFTLRCSGWVDSDLPITYRFAYRLGSGPLVSLSPYAAADSLVTVLPSGPSPSNIVTVYAYIADAYLVAAIESAQVLVRPTRVVHPTVLPLGSVQASAGGVNVLVDSVVVKNLSGSTINVLSAVALEPEYAVVPSSASVVAGDSQWFAVTFAPLAPGLYPGRIAFAFDDATSDTVAMNGTGFSLLTINKVRDYDGSAVTTADQVPVQWGFSVYKDSISLPSLILQKDTSTISLELIEQGTYIISEADSGTAWVRLGGGSRADTLFVGVNPVTDAFVNFRPNSMTVTAYVDNDADFGTSGDRAFKEWYLEIRKDSATGPVIASADGSPLIASSLGDGTYYAVQADSAGWNHLGFVLDGVPTEDSTEAVEFTLSNGESVALSFVNASPSSSKLFRTSTYQQWATSLDSKGKLKAVAKKADKVQFRFFAVAPALVPSVSLKIKTGMIGSGVLYRGASPEDTILTWAGTKEPFFSGSIAAGETLLVHGWGVKGKPVKVQLEWGTSPKVTKAMVSSFLLNQPRLPMPNMHNIGNELFAQGAFGSGLLIGIPQGAKGGHSVVHLKYKDVQKTMNKKGVLHDDAPRCLDVFTSNQKPIDKQQKGLAPDKHDNAMLGELLALKLNIAASVYNKFPNGLGELTYNDEANPVDPMNGLTVDSIVAKAERVISCMVDISLGDTLTPDDVYGAVESINGAFADGNIDTISFAVKTELTGAVRLFDVPFLHPTAGITPRSILDAPIMLYAVPEVYRLNQNYPNPFNPVTMISFELPEPAIVTLKVFNMLGQEVAVLIDEEEYPEGIDEVEFGAVTLPSGIYFYRLIAKEINDGGEIAGDVHTMVRKMMLLK